MRKLWDFWKNKKYGKKSMTGWFLLTNALLWGGYRCSTLGSCQSGGVKRNILADHICRICDCFPGIPRRCTFCNECGNNDG